MRQHLSTFLLIALGALGVLSTQPRAATGWTEYRNEKFGFRLEYPADLFKLERTTEAGDGAVFVSPHGDARLLIGALLNDSSFTVASYQNHVERESYTRFNVTYRPSGRSWFALSGAGDGKIFYEKVVFTCSGRLINSFAMIYPAESRTLYDPIVERIEDTFRGGAECARAGLPVAKDEKRRADPAPSRSRAGLPNRHRLERAERSSLADRIARERGQDVFVVLQRTSPPYDRKVVRGYANRR